MNKPATAQPAMSWEPGGRPPRWYLWEGGFLLMGQGGGEVPAHSHHAIQLTLAFEGPFAIRQPGSEWRQARGLIVRPDVEHCFDAQGHTGAMLFIDPESSEGRWLASSLVEDITTVPEPRTRACIAELEALWERPIEGMAVGDLVRHCLEAVSPGAMPSRKLDPRISTVLATIRRTDDLRMSLEAAARAVHLSPGRLAHLFRDELGLPFRRYMLWRKVTRAMLAMGRERTLAAAAQHGDFADAAHLTRTFAQMFGMPPSALMRGDFFEIPSPFTPASTAAAASTPSASSPT